MWRSRDILMIGVVAVIMTSLVLLGCQSTKSSSTSGETAMAKSEAMKADHLSKPGFVTFEEEGRLWVLRPGEEKGEKHVTLVGAGPDGMTIKALSKTTALEYLATKEGFIALVDEEGRIWIFREGEPTEMPEKHVTRIGAGPLMTTIKAVDREVLDAYMAAKS